MTRNLLIFSAASIFLLMSCSLEVDSPQSYVLFSGGNDISSTTDNLGDYASYQYELRIQGPDGRWRSGLREPKITTSNKNNTTEVSVLFEVPRLWVGRRYQFFICALNNLAPSETWLLLGLEAQKIEKDTNFIRVEFKEGSGAGLCREE